LEPLRALGPQSFLSESGGEKKPSPYDSHKEAKTTVGTKQRRRLIGFCLPPPGRQKNLLSSRPSRLRRSVFGDEDIATGTSLPQNISF